MERSNEGVQENISNVQLARPRDLANLLNEITFAVKGKKTKNQVYQTISKICYSYLSEIQEALDEVKEIQNEILGWYDNVGIESKGLMEDRDRVCTKIEQDLVSLSSNLEYFMKSYRGFGYDGLE